MKSVDILQCELSDRVAWNSLEPARQVAALIAYAAQIYVQESKVADTPSEIELALVEIVAKKLTAALPTGQCCSR